MYLAANFRVWILDNLSDGKVGMILRNDAKASLRLCVRCLSRTLARTRWDWTSWCCRWFSWEGDALLPLELWLIRLATDRCRWLLSRRCLLLDGALSWSWWWNWLLLLMELSPLCSEPPESESRECSDRRFLSLWWWRRWWWEFWGERLLSFWRWCKWLSLYSWWPTFNKMVVGYILHTTNGKFLK